MKNIILFDVNQQHFDLLPLAFTRPVSDIRIGILTIREKWEHRLPGMYSYLTPEYMAAKYPAALSDDNIFIASHILPDDSLVKQISDLDPGEAIVCNQELLAFRGNEADFRNERYNRTIEYDHTLKCIRHLYDIFLMNGECASIICLVLFCTTGIILQPVFSANLRLPSLKGAISPVLLLVPSGKMVIDIPFLIYSIP